ncbi:MAG TPA: PQQ-binding-like beta-propeller repeat protein [Thermoanaerobaculia bacterium]|nr:PQQ-binding-like beta-propeller repeat protein [Thermoanaerobaculia bacterium]
MRRHAPVSFLLILLAALPCLAGDWPRFLGAKQDGISPETGLPRSWPEGGPRVVWKRAIGEGYSGVSVASGRLYTQDSDEKTEFVLCLDAATGKEIWRVPIGEKLVDNMGSGPRGTPTVDGGTIYALGSMGRLVALKAVDGGTVWTVELVQAFGAKRPTWGYSGSPLIDGDLLVLEVGGTEKRGVVAFEKETGKVRWAAREGDPAYSTPVLMTIGGIKQYVTTRRAGPEIVSLRSDGTLHWTYPGPPTVVTSPLFIPPDKVYVSAGDDAGALLLRIKTEGGQATAEKVWETRGMKNHFNHAVLVGEHLYGFDNATFKCISVATGEPAWAQRGLGKGSLLATADGLLIVLSDRGKLLLVEAAPESYKELASFQAMEGKSWTSPTLANGKVYLRDEDEMIALDLGVPGAPAAGRVAEAPARAGTSPAPTKKQVESVDDVIAKHVAARGGAERWRAVQSMDLAGTYRSFSEDRPFTLRRKRPGSYRFETNTMRSPVTVAHNGVTAWWIFPPYGINEAAKAPDPDALLIAREAEIEPVLLDSKAKGHKVELAGKGDVNGQETVVLKVTLANGSVETWHLDPKTWLEVAVDSKTRDYTQSSEEMQQRAYFSDFRTVNGLVIPHRIEKEYGARATLMVIEKVRIDAPLDDALFALPVKMN